MIEGVRDYQSIDITSNPSRGRIIWRKANARLIDYGGDASAPALLCVPSLINRASIFDLHPDRSLVRYLRREGVRVLVLDWDTPSLREKRYSMADYTEYLLLEALASLRALHRADIHLLGYCMGGLFALAAAQLAPQKIASLILLATPFARIAAPQLTDAQWQRFEDFIRQQDSLHPAITQTLFHLLDPWHFQEKFARFQTLSASEKQHFAQVEQWVNDGVPLSRYVAQECYIRWPREDYFAGGLWKVRGQSIDPKQVKLPALCVLPQQDKIVPLSSSAPLAQDIAGAKQLSPQSGHINMLVGRRARAQLWQPLKSWISG